MVDELLKPATVQNGNNDEWFGCSARVASLRLLAWTLHRPGDPIVDQLVADLMGDQKSAHWLTTQGDAWALLALTEYSTRVEGKLHPAEGTLTWGGSSAPFKLGEEAGVFEQTFTSTPDLATTPLTLANPARSRLFATVKIEARSAVAQQPRQDRGFSLQRSYARLDDENQPQDLSNLRVGDRVLVTLRLALRQPAYYLAVDDALPSVFEAINPEFKTQQSQPGALPAGNTAGFNDTWYSSYHELRADRALFFADWIGAGQYTIRYLARVRAAGTVTAPSAKAEEMYHPERFGASGSVAVEAKAMGK